MLKKIMLQFKSEGARNLNVSRRSIQKKRVPIFIGFPRGINSQYHCKETQIMVQVQGRVHSHKAN